MSQKLSIRKLSPVIGAEVEGVDLSRPLGDETFRAIHDALMENLALFFRDQHLSPEQHKAFGRRFGEFHMHPAPFGLLDGHPEILIVKADENSRHVAGEEWHSDVSCDPEPPMGSILYVTEVPPVGGDTLFASMYAAYDALSDTMKRFLCGLTAIHDGGHVYGGHTMYEQRAEYPRSEHPLVRTHPVTGRKALFVNRGFTTRIAQLRRRESDALLEMLYRHIETPEFHCRFRWEANSVAFWDNRCAQHRALFDYYPHRRYGHRVTIAGDKPFYRP